MPGGTLRRWARAPARRTPCGTGRGTACSAPRSTGSRRSSRSSSPPTTRRDGALWLTDDIAEATRLKIRAILRVAACNGHDGLVLSAFGCGAYCNPPHHVAQLFAEVLAEQELAGVFKAIAFAIFDDHNAHRGHNPLGNLRPFQETFEGWGRREAGTA